MKILFSDLESINYNNVVFLLDESLTPGRTKLAQNITKFLEGNESFKGKKGDITSFSILVNEEYKNITLLGIGKQNELNEVKAQELGGKLASHLNDKKIEKAAVIVDNIESSKEVEVAVAIASGAKLKNYSFNKYFVNKSDEHKLTLSKIDVKLKNNKEASEAFSTAQAVIDGTLLTRDLVSEPSNILYPETFAKRCQELESFGIKVRVLDAVEMKKLGMNALLGVAQGSAKEPYMVVMEWNGAGNEDPVALVGKGVTFDTGGINLKPSNGIAEMKYDMGGAGVVTGVMHSLAARKAKINVVGALGLVENMPSGTAQRPSDVVKTMSGQTVEVDNTDAEGRLVLADVLWWVQQNYKTKFIVDFATLTGAMVVALGDGYAGFFSNDDELAHQISEAGINSGDLVWRLPLSEHYDKQVDSDIADIKNTGQGRGAGSITAAQFLQRFIKNNKWAHIDIAGMTWNKRGDDLVPKGATGYGVRLINKLLASYYEK